MAFLGPCAHEVGRSHGCSWRFRAHAEFDAQVLFRQVEVLFPPHSLLGGWWGVMGVGRACVLRGLLGDGTLLSSSLPLLHSALVPGHAQPGPRRQGPRRPAARPLREQLLDEFPWLRAADLDVDYDMPAEEDGNEGEQEAEEEVVIDEEEYDRIRQAIIEVRAE